MSHVIRNTTANGAVLAGLVGLAGSGVAVATMSAVPTVAYADGEVARIGDVEYVSLQEAIDAVKEAAAPEATGHVHTSACYDEEENLICGKEEGEDEAPFESNEVEPTVITLLSDCGGETISVSGRKTIFLDLGGHTLTTTSLLLDEGASLEADNGAIVGTVTLRGNAEIEYDKRTTFTLGNSASLSCAAGTKDAITIVPAEDANAAFNTTVAIGTTDDGGAGETHAAVNGRILVDYAIAQSYPDTEAAYESMPLVILSDANVTSADACAIAANGAARVVVNGGKVEGATSGIEVRAGSLYVAGNAVIQGRGTASTNPSTSNEGVISGAGVSVAPRKGADDKPLTLVATIASGTLLGNENDGSASLVVSNVHGFADDQLNSNVAVYIQGGTYDQVPSPVAGVISASGGTYKSGTEEDLRHILAEGFLIERHNDGSLEAYTHFAKVGDVTYKTTQAAIDAAQDGDTVTIVAPWEFLSLSGLTVSGNKSVTLDLAMKSLAIDDPDADGNQVKYGIKVEEGSGLTIKNGAISSSKAEAVIYTEGDLVIDDFATIDGSTLAKADGAAISAHAGTVTIKSGSTIFASMGAGLGSSDGDAENTVATPHAIDVFGDASVTVEADAEGTHVLPNGKGEAIPIDPAAINGAVRVNPTGDGEPQASLTINGGEFDASFDIDKAYAGKGKVVVNGGRFVSDLPSDEPGAPQRIKYPPLQALGYDDETGTFVLRYTVSSPDVQFVGLEGETFSYRNEYIQPITDIIVRAGSGAAAPYQDQTSIKDKFDVAYAGNLNAGTAYATITGKAGTDFAGTSRTIEFTIEKVEITEVTLQQPSMAYDGSAQDITSQAVVKAGDFVVPSQDMTVAASPTPVMDAKEYTVTATGDGVNVKGSATATFKIEPKDIAGCSFDGFDGTGTFSSDALYVSDAGRVLSPSTDYSISVSDGSDALHQKVTVSGAGNYTGSVSKEFVRANGSLDISEATIYLPVSSFVWDGNPKTPDVVVSHDGSDLSPWDEASQTGDYSLAYSANENAGTATVLVTGHGSWSGNASATFEITRAPVQMPSAATGITYDTAVKQGVAADPLISLSGDVTAIDAGSYVTHVALADANHQWNDGTTEPKDVSWEIAPCPVTFAFSQIRAQTYTAAPICPQVEITTPGLVGVTYDGPVYENNVNANQQGTVTVTATGNYVGTGVATFDIVPAKARITVDSHVILYGDPEPTLTATVDGLMGSDDIGYAVTRTGGRAPGTYVITATVTDANPNYDVDIINGTLRIEETVGNVAIAPIDDSRIRYTGQPIEPAITVTGVPSDFTYEVTYTDNVNAGTATVSIQGTGKYADYTAMRSFTISKVPATISVDDKKKNVGEPDPEFTASVAGTINGEQLNYTLTRAAGESTGAYAITATLGENRNYNVSIVKGRLTISATIAYDDEPQRAFIDVNAATPHTKDIEWLAANSISTGWPVGGGKYEFRPGDDIVRADMAAFLYRLALREGLVSLDWQPDWATRHMFNDVTTATSHSTEIWWLASQGISEGWPTGDTREFRPYDKIARQDMAAFMFRFAQLDGRGGAGTSWSPSASDRSSFSDVTSATPHSREIWWLSSNGISTGWTTNGRKIFVGQGSVLRQDMAAFLRRLDGTK